MKRIICLMLSIVIVLSAVPAMAADNTVKLTGEGIFIDNDTESTVWADKNGGTLVWNKEANTLAFNSFNYDFAERVGNYGSGFLIRPECSIILNGTSIITSSAKVIYTMALNGAVINGGGKLTVYGPNLEPEDTEKYFPVSWSAYSAAVDGSLTLNSGTLEAVGGTMKCDNKENLYDFANSSTAAGVWCNGFDTIRINGGQLIAKGGAVISDITSGVKISGSGAAKHIGGMVGSSEENWKGSLTVERCIFSGTINLPNVSDCVGGVMGYANDFVSILYCGFNGSVTGKKDGYIGGILGYINNEISEVLKTRLRRAKQMERRLSGRSEIAATV